MSVVTRTLDSLRSYLGSFTWAPLVDVSRRSVLSILRRIENGQLIIRDVDGSVLSFGNDPGEGADKLVTSLQINKEAFWVQLLLFADMVGDARLQNLSESRADADLEARALLRALCLETSNALTLSPSSA